MSAVPYFTVTPFARNLLQRRHPFTLNAVEDQAVMKHESMKCQIELILDNLVGMSRTEKTAAYLELSAILTQNCWLPPDTELYQYMQDGFGALFDVWNSLIPDLPAITDECILIFTTLGRCQFTSGLFDRLSNDITARLTNEDDSDELRAKCATALVLGSIISQGAIFRSHCELLFRVAFDQSAGIETRKHFLRMAALYMAHFDREQMQLFAGMDNTLSRLLDLLEKHQELQVDASTCLVVMLKAFTPQIPAPLQKIVTYLKDKAKNSQPFRYNLKFLLKENRIESIEKFPEIGEQVKIDSIKMRLIYDTFKIVLESDLVHYLGQCENSFVRQTLKPESMLMAKRDEKKNVLVRTIRRLF